MSMPRAGRSAQALGYCVAVQPGQADIQKNDVRPEEIGGFERRGSIIDGLHFMPASLEQHGQNVSGIPIIIHNEHTVRRRRGLL